MKFSHVPLLVTSFVFFSISSFGQGKNLSLVKVIDTMLSVTATNNTGVQKYVNLSGSLKSTVLTVPKGRVWVVNLAQAGHSLSGWFSLYDNSTGSGSDTRSLCYLSIEEGGQQLYQNGVFPGRATFNEGTKISVDVRVYGSPYSDVSRTWYRHTSSPKVRTLGLYMLCITEYELVP